MHRIRTRETDKKNETKNKVSSTSTTLLFYSLGTSFNRLMRLKNEYA